MGQVRGNLNSTRGKLQEMTQSSLDLRERIAKLEGDRQILATNLSATKSDMERLRQARTEADEREAAARTVATRLQQYDGKQLHVGVRRRRLVVTIDDAELFLPGEAALVAAAAVPLRALSGLMRELSERDFLVGGHTDNSSPRGSAFKSNWDLTTSRAVAVVRYLQGEGVDPRHLVAAGFSEFDPIADNATDAGRNRNRRIEVVLLPTLKELPEVVLAPAPTPAPAR